MTAFIERKRTHNCGELRASDVGSSVVVMGWIHGRRDHGGCVFVDLRDRYGLTQIKFDPSLSDDAHQLADTVRSEWVIGVAGEVVSRGENVNDRMATGAIEIAALSLTVFNTSKTPRFQIRDNIDTHEDLRLKFRFLDLRRPAMQQRIITRSKVTFLTRLVMEEEGFLELETPILTRSTPEGARDYLVPSRVYPGSFFALPQSPQLFKQLYMIAGYDRYYQICRCFRDEDLRADRQPEFTQIDIEMSFVGADDVMALAEGVAARIFKETIGHEIPLPVPRMTYDEAIAKYGIDRPDLRFGLELSDVSSAFAHSDFNAFASVVKKGGMVKGLGVPNAAKLSRKQLDLLTKFVGNYGAKGLAWIKINEDGWRGPIVKFLSDEVKAELTETLGLEVGAVAFFVADTASVANAAMGQLRVRLAEDLGLIDEKALAFTWVTDFPAFEHDEEADRYVAIHHPFTSPKPSEIEKLESDPMSVKTDAYDLVLNGTELAGGSVRIHDPSVQSRVFRLLGMGDDEARAKFGFLLEALEYGAPPHAGIAFGLDRLVALLTRVDSIRDVIAFPKTQKSACLMTEAPSVVENDQLVELGIRTLPKVD